MFSSKMLHCKECDETFEFTVGEQEFFAEKGFTNEPSRCPSCRQARKNRNRDQGNWSSRRERPMFEVTCNACGQTARVPFQPDGSRPVYCSDCFRNNSSYSR